jgi:Cu(I)/Ag(I) efflux system protein CusF
MKVNAIIIGAAVATTAQISHIAAAQVPATRQAEATAPSAATEMTQGEIQKVDKDTGRLTIKHGEIKNLGMPPMTMVFGTKDKSMADKVKTGDKIRFKAVNENGKMTVTEITPDK